MNFKILKLDEQNRLVVLVKVSTGQLNKTGQLNEEAGPEEDAGYDVWSLQVPHKKTIKDGEGNPREVPMSADDYKNIIVTEINNYERETEGLKSQQEKAPLVLEKMIGKEVSHESN